MTAVVAFTTTTPTASSRRLGAIARVLNAPRTPSPRSQGQAWFEDTPWCFICSRATDHTGEHTPEQIAAYQAGRRRSS